MSDSYSSSDSISVPERGEDTSDVECEEREVEEEEEDDDDEEEEGVEVGCVNSVVCCEAEETESTGVDAIEGMS